MRAIAALYCHLVGHELSLVAWETRAGVKREEWLCDRCGWHHAIDRTTAWRALDPLPDPGGVFGGRLELAAFVGTIVVASAVVAIALVMHGPLS